jgi:hypothetical protein
LNAFVCRAAHNAAASMRPCRPDRSAHGAEKDVLARYRAVYIATGTMVPNMFLLVGVRIADPCQNRMKRQKLPQTQFARHAAKRVPKQNGSP